MTFIPYIIAINFTHCQYLSDNKLIYLVKYKYLQKHKNIIVRYNSKLSAAAPSRVRPRALKLRLNATYAAVIQFEPLRRQRRSCRP